MARRLLLIHSALAFVTLLVYVQAAGFEFVRLDDPGYVTKNERVLEGLTPGNVAWAFSTTAQANWHPLTWLSLMLDAEIGGGRPAAFHITNVLLHLAGTLLLFHVFRRMTGRTGPSAFVAAMFAIHPLHVESVAWVAERKDVLSTLFWMLATLAYLRYAERPGSGRYALLLAAFAAGLMSKPMLVTLPLVLLLLDEWPLKRFAAATSGVLDPGLWWRRVRDKLPLVALSAVSSLATLHAQSALGAVGTLEEFPLRVRAANAVVSCVAYIGKMLWPVGLAVPYPYRVDALTPPRVIGSALLLAAVSAFCLGWSRRRRYLAVGWLWYAITLLPVIGLVQVGTQSMADRYTYVPLIGLFLIVAWGVADVLKLDAAGAGTRRKLAGGAAIAVTLVLAAVAHVQAGHWKNTTSLFTHALRVTERNATAHDALALELFSRGRLDEALDHYREALRISPTYLGARVNMGAALVEAGRVEEAIAVYREALGLSPTNRLARTALGDLLIREGRTEEAAEHLRTILRETPDSAYAHKRLGTLAATAGRAEEAVGHYAEALESDPGDAETRVELATTLMQLGRDERAAAEFERALRDDRDNLSAHKNLGVLLARRGDLGGAIAHFEESLRIDPGDEGARRNLARAQALLERARDE